MSPDVSSPSAVTVSPAFRAAYILIENGAALILRCHEKPLICQYIFILFT